MVRSTKRSPIPIPSTQNLPSSFPKHRRNRSRKSHPRKCPTAIMSLGSPAIGDGIRRKRNTSGSVVFGGKSPPIANGCPVTGRKSRGAISGSRASGPRRKLSRSPICPNLLPRKSGARTSPHLRRIPFGCPASGSGNKPTTNGNPDTGDRRSRAGFGCQINTFGRPTGAFSCPAIGIALLKTGASCSHRLSITSRSTHNPTTFTHHRWWFTPNRC